MPSTIITWNARALMCHKRARRRRKQAALSKHMRQRHVILLQEVHGSEALLRTWVDTQPYPYKLFFSEFVEPDDGEHRPGTGGVATLVPWLTPTQLEFIPQAQLPIFGHEEIVKGRVQVIAITNSVTRNSLVLMNVHNHDIDARGRDRVQRAWHQHRTWAELNYQHRTFIAMGDFNTASRPPNSFFQPQPQHARLALDNSARQQQPFWKALFDSMLEIESDLPTLFNKSDYTASAIDHCQPTLARHA